MEITAGGQKLVLSLDSQRKSVTIPRGFVGRIFIDIDGKVSEVTAKEAAVNFATAKDTSDIGYGWAAK